MFGSIKGKPCNIALYDPFCSERDRASFGFIRGLILEPSLFEIHDYKSNVVQYYKTLYQYTAVVYGSLLLWPPVHSRFICRIHERFKNVACGP